MGQDTRGRRGIRHTVLANNVQKNGAYASLWQNRGRTVGCKSRGQDTCIGHRLATPNRVFQYLFGLVIVLARSTAYLRGAHSAA